MFDQSTSCPTLHFRVYANKRTINSSNGFELLVQTWIVLFVIRFPKNIDANEQEVEMKIEITWESLFINFEVLILWWAHYVGVTIQTKPLWYINVVRLPFVFRCFYYKVKVQYRRVISRKNSLGLYSYQEQIRSLWRRAMMLIMIRLTVHSFDYVFSFFPLLFFFYQGLQIK